MSPPVEIYAKLNPSRTFAFEILDDTTAARIGSIHYASKKAEYELVMASNVIDA